MHIPLEIEQRSLYKQIMSKDHFPTSEERMALMHYVDNKITTEGMTTNEYNKLQNCLLAPGWVVWEFISLGLRWKDYIWTKDKIIKGPGKSDNIYSWLQH